MNLLEKLDNCMYHIKIKKVHLTFNFKTLLQLAQHECRIFLNSWFIIVVFEYFFYFTEVQIPKDDNLFENFWKWSRISSGEITNSRKRHMVFDLQ